MSLTVVTWWWGDRYDVEFIERLAAGLKKHLHQEHQLIVVSGRPGVSWVGIKVVPIPNPELTKDRGCFARLRMFDPGWQESIGAGERIACIDLDVIVTGELDPLFNRPEQFVILQGANAANPCPYNGSIWFLRKGYRPDVWSDFSIEAASKIKKYEFADDQGWFWHKMPDAAGWKVGPTSGIYAFKKPAWPQGDDLPKDARLVVFPGWRSPEKFTALPWVQKHWVQA